jgi:aquaporin Z
VLGGIALTQLWMFWVAPLVGGVLGGLLHRWLSTEEALDTADRTAAARAGATSAVEALAPSTAREPR